MVAPKETKAIDVRVGFVVKWEVYTDESEKECNNFYTLLVI